MSNKGRPAGPFSIGRALDIPPGAINDDLRLSVEAIDRVHGVGHLPRIPMEFRSQLGIHGRFDFDESTGEPIRIVIDRRAPYRSFIAVHEVGHFLDLASLGEGPLFGSKIKPLLADWLSAATRSEAYASAKVLLDQQPVVARYKHLSPEELWARSYAQYIAGQSGSHDLLQGLDAFRSVTSEGLHNLLQWQDNDFVEIATAIDVLFLKLGWRE